MDEQSGKLRGVGIALVEECQVTRAVGRADVEQQAPRAVRVLEPGGLEHIARDLVYRRIAVSAERRVWRGLAQHGRIARDRLGVVESVCALVPLRAAVWVVAARDQAEVVVVQVDERRRPGVRRRGLDAGGVVDGQPLAVRARAGRLAAARGAVLHGRPTVARRGDPQARQRVQVGEVLLGVVVELELGVTAAWRLLGPDERARWRAGAYLAEGLAAVDRSLPHASLRARSGRAADEHAAERVDADVGLAERVDRVDDGRRRERDARGARLDRRSRDCHRADRGQQHR